MNKTPTYSLRELASLAALEPRTIRNWISSGLLPGPITAGRNARYGQGTLDRLRFVKVVRERTGLPLADIRRLLLAIGDDQMRDVAEGRLDAVPTLLTAADRVSEDQPSASEAASSRPMSLDAREPRPDETRFDLLGTTGVMASPFRRLAELKRRYQRRGLPRSDRDEIAGRRLPGPDVATPCVSVARADKSPVPSPAAPMPRLEQAVQNLERALAGEPAAGVTGAADQASPVTSPPRIPRRAHSDWWASIRVTPDLELRARGFEGDDLARLERIADLLRHVLTGESSQTGPRPAVEPRAGSTGPPERSAGSQGSAKGEPRKE